MKVITLFVHTNIQQEITQFLTASEQVSGFTYTQVEGRGVESEPDGFVQAHDNIVGYVPRLRVELLVNDVDVSTLLQNLRDSELKLSGHSFYWVTEASEGGHL